MSGKYSVRQSWTFDIYLKLQTGRTISPPIGQLGSIWHFVTLGKVQQTCLAILLGTTLIHVSDLLPHNQYIWTKDVFKLQQRGWVVIFEFINKDSDFLCTEHSAIEDYPVYNFHIPRKINEDGTPDLKTFSVILKGNFNESPLEENRVYLMVENINDSNE